MDAIIAIQVAVKYAARIKGMLKPELTALIGEEFKTEDFWMDKISPTAWFSSERELLGFVLGVIMNHISKKSKTMSIQFEASFVLDAWTEKLNSGAVDYIKLRNGIKITINRNRVSIFDSDDLEVSGSEVKFTSIATRKDEAFDGHE